MAQLRPHLTEEEFVPRIRGMQQTGFLLAFLSEGEMVRAVAGFRFLDKLHTGRTLYVDDLVTDSAARSQGHGDRLLDWLTQTARAAGCALLELDSGVQRGAAHRFYFRKRMTITSHHFALPL